MIVHGPWHARFSRKLALNFTLFAAFTSCSQTVVKGIRH